MKKFGLIILLGLSQAFPSVAQQQQVTLDLQQTIKMANDSSLEAFRTKNMYLSGYWEYRTLCFFFFSGSASDLPYRYDIPNSLKDTYF